MNKERLEYLLEYASKLQGFQSIASVHLHKEVNEVVNEIRQELSLDGKKSTSEIVNELYNRKGVIIHEFSDDGYAKIERQHDRLSGTYNDLIEGEATIIVIK